MLTPDEATRHLRAGTQAQYVTPAYVANAIRQVQAMASGYRP
jgi:hypothetical protein